MNRRTGRRPLKRDALDKALRDRGFEGGLLGYVAARDAADPRPTFAEIADELYSLGKERVSSEMVRRWANQHKPGEKEEVVAA